MLLDRVMESFILCDSFLQESLLHSPKKELVKQDHSFFSGSKKRSGEKQPFYGRLYALFLLFSTHCEFLRFCLSHSPAERENTLLSSFS